MYVGSQVNSAGNVSTVNRAACRMTRARSGQAHSSLGGATGAEDRCAGRLPLVAAQRKHAGRSIGRYANGPNPWPAHGPVETECNCLEVGALFHGGSQPCRDSVVRKQACRNLCILVRRREKGRAPIALFRGAACGIRGRRLALPICTPAFDRIVRPYTTGVVVA